ncbi:STAS/SEC14 domain-containing protein [Microbulbifer litoralis]|uniref:STAS/SEC14 domain-containing protein n=1 Tax=Microbulbifer litoralis TaxID=2933965 RepID=UPI002027C6CC|nr:STAS/SEC14 domain-containing protein [Microbulbifer sp. GX H0434]
MFRVQRIGDRRVDLEISGRLDSEGMKTALDELSAACEGIERGRMLCDVMNYRLPSPGALAVEFSRLPSLLRLVGRFDRAAVLADEAWLQKASELEGRLIPGLEIRAFGRNRRGEAEAWLAR